MKTATSTMWKWIAILGVSASWMLAQSASADVYLGRDGGLEGTATVDNSQTNPATAGKWTKNNTTQTIAEETTLVRSGSKSIRLYNSSTTARRVWTPLVSFGSKTAGVTIQYYRMITNSSSCQTNQIGVLRASESLQGTYDKPASINTWEKKTYSPASATFSSIAGVIMHRAVTAGAGDLYVDDLCIYDGSVDTVAPAIPGALAVTTNSLTALDLSWTASADVDGGGYLVVRYAAAPAATDDPNANGIYATNNVVSGSVNGTVVYQGDGLSFTDSGLTTDQTYHYKLYAYDKAYNYATETEASGTPAAESASAPSVTTVAASATNATGATANGDVTADGGDTVTERGVCYKTSSGVVLTDNPTAAAAGGTGAFSVDLSSLSVNQIYYFRAYAENGVGTTLAANELSFTTLANVPAAPTVDNPTATTLDVAVNANDNPAATEFAILRTNDNTYLQADGTFGAAAVWQTASVWDTTTATGLTPETEYFFQVKARNGANVETAFGAVASETTAAAATGIWINPMSAGAPMGSYYLGDVLGEWFVNFEIGQESWNYAQIGLGTATDGSGYNWGEAGWYQDGDWPNKRVRRNLSGFQFTAVANYYVICQARAAAENDYTSKSGAGWGNSTFYPPTDLSAAYFAVSAINDASGQAAAANDADPTHALDLSWTKNAQGHNVMVVRKAAAAAWTEPAQGTTYSASDALGAGTVVYVGSGTSTTDSGLSEDSTYDYKFYSVNNGYYAAGVTAQGETLPCEPDAPTALHASETNETDFTASWTASDRATGYRLDVSTEEQFGVSSYAADLFISEYIEGTSNNKAVEIFNGTGAAVDLAAGGYTLRVYANGGTSPTTITLTGTLAAGDVFVVANGSANAAILAQADMTSGSLTHNGNDQIALAKSSVNIDVIGTIGLNVTNLIDVTKVRKSAISQGVTTYDVAEWTDYAVDTTSYLGSHDYAGGLTPSFVAGYENLAIAGTSQLVEGLDDNTTYYFRVRAEGEGGCPSANSTTASVTTPEAVGGPQTIDFPAIADKLTTNVVVLSATASSGLDVSFAVFSGPAVLGEDGVTLTFTGAGEVSVVASQAGGGGWDPAVPVTNTFAVTKVAATVTLDGLAQAYDGTARSVTATTVPEGLTVDVTYAGGATPPTDPGQYEVVGTIVDDLYQGATTNTLTVSVAAPASFAGVSAGMDAVELSFAPNAAGNAVVIVANATGTFGEPSGTPTVGETLAGGTVLYVGTASPQTHADLQSCTPYYYQAWSYVDGFYSTGLADDASTDAPDAPTGLSAAPDYTSFVASWDAAAGATGYRLDVSTEADFATGGGAGSVYVADFEDASKTSYGSGNVTLNGISWNLNEAVIGDLANDRKNGLKSARVRSNETVNASGILSMNEDLATGLSSITFVHGKYGTDADTTGRVEYSVNGGSSWVSAGTFTANSTNLTPFSATNLNVTGNVRVRIVKTSGTTTRFNVDDVKLYPYDPPTPSFVTGYENLAVAGTSQVVSGLAEGATYYFRVRTEGDNCTSADSAVASVATLEHLRPEISQAAVNVREGGEGRFFVRLNKDPGTDVVVAIARSAGDASLTVQDGATRNFKSSNWSSWQTVTLAAPADDADVDGETATFQVSMSGADDQFVEATALDDDFTNNLALASGGSAISASYAYSRPEQLIDGVHASSVNYGFVVCTSVPPGTITLDLKVISTVSRVRVLTWDWVRLVHRYAIESSTDGSNWTTLIDATGADHHGWDDWAVANVALRYLRFTGESTTQNRDALSVAELEVYGTRDLSGLPQPVLSASALNVREDGEGRFFLRLDKAPEGIVTVNVERNSGDEDLSIVGGATRTFKASNWDQWQAVTLTAAADADADGETAVFRIASPGAADQFVTATALDDEIGDNLALAAAGSMIAGSRRPAELIDGVHAVSTNYGYTTWTSAVPGTMVLDLKQATRLSRIRLLNWDWVYRVHRYVIESSLDGANWSALVDATGEAHQGWDDWTLADQPARYLRFTGVSNSANAYVVVSELEVYGVASPLPELELSTDAVNVREGGEGRFFVRLAGAPTGNVAVAVARSGGDASLTVQQGAARSFTPLNWNQWQMVTLAQAADENAAGETATFQVSAAGYAHGVVTATALDDDIAENLALTATVAAWKAYRPGQVNDGIHASSANYGYTIWTNVPAGTLTMDLGAQMTVSRIRLLNWDWVYRVHRYQIEASTDGASWSTLIDATGADRMGWDDWAVANETIRYLRFIGTSNSANAYVCLSELEVYGTRPGRRAFGTAGAVESEPISVLTSAGAEDASGWNAVDGDAATAWTAPANAGYLVVEYGPTLDLRGLELELADGSPANVEVLTSLDAVEWQPLPEDLEKTPVSLNFLWLIFPGDGTEALPAVVDIRPNP